MRKYFQITFFLSIFGALVFLRQFKGTGDIRVIGGNQNTTPVSNNPTQPQNPTTAPQQSNNQGSGSMMPTSMPAMGMYKNGTYTGTVQDAFYGNIQVQIVISNGKISTVNFLQFPNDNPTSRYINSQADPMLAQEAVQAQNASVNIISGASASSQAFQQSLADALSQAK